MEAARRDGRITDEFSDLPWFRKALKQASATPPDLSAFDAHRYTYLDDPVGALGWTAESFGQPIKNPFKDVGRNDPAPAARARSTRSAASPRRKRVPRRSAAGPVLTPFSGLSGSQA